MGFILPARGYGITSSWADHKNRRPPSGEPGTDYAYPYGTRLVAPEAGTIVEVKTTNSGAMGRRILLRTIQGHTIDLIHLSRIHVRLNQQVAQGEYIADSGASAWGSNWGVGAHTHVSLWLNGGPYSKGWAATVDFDLFVNTGGGGGSASGGQWPARTKYGAAWVTSVQKKLIKMGHDLGKGGADGYDGPRTQAVVKYEQQMSAKHGFKVNGHNIAVDAIAGPEFNAFLDWWLAKSTPASAPGYQDVNYDNIARIGDVQGLQKIAQLNGYTGHIDNAWGPGSKAGFKKFIDRNYGGSITRWLRERWGYVGNDQLGPVMIAALQRANARNKAEL